MTTLNNEWIKVSWRNEYIKEQIPENSCQGSNEKCECASRI